MENLSLIIWGCVICFICLITIIILAILLKNESRKNKSAEAKFSLLKGTVERSIDRWAPAPDIKQLDLGELGEFESIIYNYYRKELKETKLEDIAKHSKYLEDSRNLINDYRKSSFLFSLFYEAIQMEPTEHFVQILVDAMLREAESPTHFNAWETERDFFLKHVLIDKNNETKVEDFRLKFDAEIALLLKNEEIDLASRKIIEGEVAKFVRVTDFLAKSLDQ
jgi:hypothetical protein